MEIQYLCKHKCSLQHMANLGQLLAKNDKNNLKIKYNSHDTGHMLKAHKTPISCH